MRTLVCLSWLVVAVGCGDTADKPVDSPDGEIPLIEFRKQIPDKKLHKDMQGHVIEQFLLCGSPDPKD